MIKILARHIQELQKPPEQNSILAENNPKKPPIPQENQQTPMIIVIKSENPDIKYTVHMIISMYMFDVLKNSIPVFIRISNRTI